MKHAWESFRWYAPDGGLVSCTEKLKVMHDNLDELAQMAQDLLEDAVLMGIDEQQVRDELRRIIDQLDKPFAD